MPLTDSDRERICDVIDAYYEADRLAGREKRDPTQFAEAIMMSADLDPVVRFDDVLIFVLRLPEYQPAAT